MVLKFFFKKIDFAGKKIIYYFVSKYFTQWLGGTSPTRALKVSLSRKIWDFLLLMINKCNFPLGILQYSNPPPQKLEMSEFNTYLIWIKTLRILRNYNPATYNADIGYNAATMFFLNKRKKKWYLSLKQKWIKINLKKALTFTQT